LGSLFNFRSLFHPTKSMLLAINAVLRSSGVLDNNSASHTIAAEEAARETFREFHPEANPGVSVEDDLLDNAVCCCWARCRLEDAGPADALLGEAVASLVERELAEGLQFKTFLIFNKLLFDN
jgi:hypothetical protein